MFALSRHNAMTPAQGGYLSSYRGGGAGFGVNRNTWRAGQTVGRALKRWWSKRDDTRIAAKERVLKKRKTTHNKIRNGVVCPDGAGGQWSQFVIPASPCYLPKHVENALPPLAIQINGAGQLKSGIGLQNVVSAFSLFSPASATTYTGDKITRVLYNKATASLTLNNIYLSNAYIRIYDIVARKDIGASSPVGNPVAAWEQGDTDESVSNQYTYLGAEPWSAEVFNQYYSVKQITKVVLGAGQTHVHSIRMEPNKVISSAYATYTPAAFKDITYFCMVEIHGSPANDTVTQSQVTVGYGGVNYVWDQEVTLKQLMKATPSISGTNSLPIAFSNGEQVVNIGGTTITTNLEG